MNADPKRPDKVQRYVPSKNNANGEDLTPDYMNIMGQPATTANAAGGETVEKHQETGNESIHHRHRPEDVVQNDELTMTTNAANVIPTSPQYGVAIIPNNIVANDLGGAESMVNNVPVTDNLTENVANKVGEDNKDIHSTPSRNDRFKVVKIASLEPFKRGRWKCMDYVDEAPPPNVVNSTASKTTQSIGYAAIPGTVPLQTQSLPQQQIQQMLMQGGFTNGAQFFHNVPAQLIPQGQFFYPQVANVQSQTVAQPGATSMPTPFMNNQPYFAAVTNPAGFTLPQGYPNIQYVPIPAQGSAFVPTSQAVHLPTNFQQSQSYAGQPTQNSQSNMNHNMVNGHAYPPEPHLQGSTLPNQPAKMLVNSQPVSAAQPASVIQQQPYQQQPQPINNFPQQQQQQQPAGQQNSAQHIGAPSVAAPINHQPQVGFDGASNVYTNPQFTMSVNSLTVLDSSNEQSAGVKETNSSATETVSDNADDPTKNNPVVNAIDNKIEQAMDLVKSHLMYTVREEVEILKEKIVELMEKIQQLETENNYLRAQIPKNQTGAVPPQSSSQTPFSQPPNIAVVNPSPNLMPAHQNAAMMSNTVAPIATSNPPSQAIPNSNAVPQQQQQQQQQQLSKESTTATTIQ